MDAEGVDDEHQDLMHVQRFRQVVLEDEPAIVVKHQLRAEVDEERSQAMDVVQYERIAEHYHCKCQDPVRHGVWQQKEIDFRGHGPVRVCEHKVLFAWCGDFGFHQGQKVADRETDDEVSSVALVDQEPLFLHALPHGLACQHQKDGGTDVPKA